MPKIDYIYCDANVFLAYFNQEKGRTQILDQLFEEVHKNSLKKIITSALTITEVSHIADERNRNRTNATIQQVFEDFWSDTTLIEFIDFNERLARQARDLIRQAIDVGMKLRTNDGIHLASAKMAGVAEFFTYDIKLFQFSKLMGYSIREPFILSPQLPLDFNNP